MWGMFFYIALFGQAPMWGLIAIGTLFLLLSASGLRTPHYTYIDEELIIVKYYLGRKVLADVASVRRITKDDLVGSFRLMGNNGFFGYTGWYYKKTIGRYYLAAVNWKELALVTLAGGKQYVINYPGELLEKKDPLSPNGPLPLYGERGYAMYPNRNDFTNLKNHAGWFSP